MIRNNLSWINLNAGSSGGSGGGGVSDYNDLANRPIISMTGTSQNPLKLWNLSTGLYLLNGYVYYNTTNTRECVNLFVSITAQIQNGKYVLSAFVPSWEGHYEYIKANSTSTDYTDTQILKMLTEDDVLTLTNEVEYTPTTDYHPSTKKYVDEAMQSVMEEFAKMGVNEQDIKTLIAENRRRDIAIQALLNETADKNVTIEEDTHTISLDYSMEDGMATVNSIEGSTLVNVSKTVDEVYITKSQDRVEQSKVANTIGEQNGKICPIIEGDTLVNVCDQKDPIAITKSYTIENSGNHIALQGEYDGKCRPVIQGNTLVNEIKFRFKDIVSSPPYVMFKQIRGLKPNTTYTAITPYFDSTLINMYVGYSGGDTLVAYQKNNIVKFTTGDTIITDEIWFYYMGTDSPSFVSTLPTTHVILEGDLTQTPELIPTEYVEGLKSSFEDNVVTQAMVDSGEESAENLGKYKVEYKVTGKNKLYKVVQGSFYQSDIYYDDNGMQFHCGEGLVRKGVTYTTNFGLKEIGYAVLLDNNRRFVEQYFIIEDNLTITPSQDGYLLLRSQSGIGDTKFDATVLQLEEGSTATPYEPYKSYTKTFYLNSPLLEGDTIEDVNGVATHVKRYGKVVLDGSDDERWANHLINETHISHYISIPNDAHNYAKISNNFKVLPWSESNRDVILNNECLWVNGSTSMGIVLLKSRLSTQDVNGFRQWLSENPTTVVYELAEPIYERISTESILCDSYVNGHLDFDSAVPIEKVKFIGMDSRTKYLYPSTAYTLQFEADNDGYLDRAWIGGAGIIRDKEVKRGLNKFTENTYSNITSNYFSLVGIGFNASNIVVTEAVDKEFDYFNGIQSTFEENLVTDENSPHYGKYRVIYRTKSSDGNASTVKSVYLNSPLLQGDKLVVVNGKLCHYHKMGRVVLDGSESWVYNSGQDSDNTFRYNLKTNIGCTTVRGNIMCDKLSVNLNMFSLIDDKEGICNYSNGLIYIRILKSKLPTSDIQGFRQWLQANPTTVVYELAEPYYEEISSNPKDTVVDFYANGTLEVQSAVYPLSMEFTSFEEELTYLYASTVYTVQFEANGNAIANITLGGTTVTNQEIIHGLNRIQVTTPSTLVDNKLIIDGCGDCKISKVVVTNSTEEFEYFEGMKSAFEDKQNEDGTYTVEIVVYNAPIRLNKDKE